MCEEAVKKYGSVWLDDYEAGIGSDEEMEAALKQYLFDPMMDCSQLFLCDFADRMMYGIPEKEMVELLDGMSRSFIIGPWHEWRPSGLYHWMLEKVIPYTIRGFLWYQGESDEDHPEIYSAVMQGLIECWRSRWNEKLPFIFTELAPFGEVIAPGGKNIRFCVVNRRKSQN